MYAVIETGGKQYRVELGTELEVELLDVKPGQEIKLERVLLVADGEKTVVGQPLVKDAAVSARVVRQDWPSFPGWKSPVLRRFTSWACFPTWNPHWLSKPKFTGRCRGVTTKTPLECR